MDGGKADQQEGARILQEFQRLGLNGVYWLAFELKVMPRHGSDRVVSGEILGTRNAQGPLTRLSIDNQHWLIQAGPQPCVWIAPAGGRAAVLPAGDDMKPVADTDLTVFDLQMPFLYWTDFVYEGLARVRGRPAHSFVLYPPAAERTTRSGVSGVRIFIDTQFQALVQAEVLGADARLEKTISVLDLKKVGEQWLVKSIDVRNHITRGKTRLTFTAAALELSSLASDEFSPERLGQPVPAPAADKVQKF